MNRDDRKKRSDDMLLSSYRKEGTELTKAVIRKGVYRMSDPFSFKKASVDLLKAIETAESVEWLDHIKGELRSLLIRIGE